MQPDRAANALGAKQHNLVTDAQLKDIGFSPGGIRYRLETGRWARLEPGVVLLTGAPETSERRIMAGVLRNDGSFATHRAAAWLLGLIDRLPDTIDLSVPNGAGRARQKGRLIHQARRIVPADIRTVRHIPVTRVERTIVDLSAMWRGEAFEAVVDKALVVGKIAITPMRNYVDRRGLRLHHGVGRLMAHLDDREHGVPESWLEREFIRILRKHRVPLPTRQKVIAPRRVDFFYDDLRIAIEVDGRVAHSSATDFQDDHDRHNHLWLAGLPPLRFTWYDLRYRPEYVVATVRAAIDARLHERSVV